ncbi:MAG: hypothetical protein ACLRNP_23380, partial [Blautia coccoides]
MAMMSQEQEKELLEKLEENIKFKYEPQKEAAPMTNERMAEIIKELEQYPSGFVAACLEKGHRRVDYY